MGVNINNVVNVTLLTDPQLAVTDNMNITMLVTTDRTVLNSNNRYKSYADANEVAADFGYNNIVTLFANVFFAQQPNPINAGGELVIGYWRNSSETTAATAGYLLGGQLNEADVVAALQQITTGAITFTIDGGSPVALTGLNFSVIDSIDDVVAILQAGLSTATVSYANQQFKVTSNTTGSSSSVDYASGSGANYVGDLLQLSSTTGASKVAGAASQTLSAETEVAALTILKQLINFKGFTFINQSTATNRYNIAVWAQANSTLGYDVFYDPNDLTRDATVSTAWKIKLASLTNYRMIYSAENQRMLGVAYMSRMHTVNFSIPDSAITMNLKTLAGVTPEDYTQSQVNAANSIGLDLYTTIKNIPVILVSTGNDTADNRYNLLSYFDEVGVDVFNLLKATNGKVPQTNLGVAQVVDCVEKTTIRYVNAGVFAPGTWTSPDTFGDIDAFKRAIEQNGFYVLADLLSNQSPADRQARKCPPIHVAVKNAGAIQHVDIIINFNI